MSGGVGRRARARSACGSGSGRRDGDRIAAIKWTLRAVQTARLNRRAAAPGGYCRRYREHARPRLHRSTPEGTGGRRDPVGTARRDQGRGRDTGDPVRAHKAVARAGAQSTDKIVVDAMNTYGVPPVELKGQPSTVVVASAFAGARVVKSPNQLPAKLLAADPVEHGGRRVMFLAGDDTQAVASVAKLVGDLGFAPIVLGSLVEVGTLLDKGGALVLQNLIKKGARYTADWTTHVRFERPLRCGRFRSLCFCFGSAAPVRRRRELTFGTCAVGA